MVTARFTVVLPSHDHGPLLEVAAATALAQTVEQWELFIVLDGADAATRGAAERVGTADSRVRIFDFPKGERHGEAHRHVALADASGDLICYLSDDDLWFPDHLETVGRLLEDADFASALSVFHRADSTALTYPGDLADAVFRNRLLVDPPYNFFGLSQGAHTRGAYARTPGWHPEHVGGIPTDLHMWRHFLEIGEIEAVSSSEVTVFTFPSRHWSDVAMEERLHVMQTWATLIGDPEWVARFRGEVGSVLKGDLNRAERRALKLEQELATMAAQKARFEQEVRALTDRAEEAETRLEGISGLLSEAEGRLADGEAASDELARIRGSVSYRAARRLAAIPVLGGLAARLGRLLAGRPR